MKEIEARLVSGVDRARLMDCTEKIARWVRLSGTPDELESFRWIEARMQEFGLKTQILMHDAYISLPGPASLEVDGLGSIETITHAMARPGNGRAEVVFGPEADAAGKILLVDGLATPAAAVAAWQRGAAAILVVNDANHHEMIISPVWGSPTIEELGRLPEIAALSIRQPDGERIKELLKRGQVFATYNTQVETGWRKTPILVAELKGPSPDYVLFSGHLDSWHYGAMDNGTANATMMEVARLLATVRGDLKRGIKFAFWSGHSHGRYSGSTWYVDNHWQDLYEHCVAHVNIDSVGGIGAAVLTEAMVHPELAALGADVVKRYTGEHYEGRRVNRSSDQSFTGVGIPSFWSALSEQPPGADAVGFTRLFGGKSGGLGWWWHTVHDTLDKIDPAFLERDCKCFVAAVSRLVLSDRLPMDPSAAADAFLGHLKEYAARAAGRVDLSPAVGRAERLLASTRRLTAASIPAERFNRAAMAISRALIPAEYTEAGPYGHDPALAVAPIPCLKRVEDLAAAGPDSDSERFLRPLVTRGLNRVVHALEQALQEAEAALK